MWKYVETRFIEIAKKLPGYFGEDESASYIKKIYTIWKKFWFW